MKEKREYQKSELKKRGAGKNKEKGGLKKT